MATRSDETIGIRYPAAATAAEPAVLYALWYALDRSSFACDRLSFACIPFPFGDIKLAIHTRGAALIAIEFVSGRTRDRLPAGGTARRVMRQLEAYFADPAATFALSLAPHGTAFQRRVWKTLCAIPAGEACSYGELARRLATSARAIGNACRRNPIPIIVPCHRVVAAAGPGGYSGDTGGDMLAIKKRLLAHEQCR